MAVVGAVLAGEEVLKLAFDVGEEGAGSEAEQVGGEPGVAEFVFHQHEVFGGVFGGADASGGFEADADAGSLVVFADEAEHHEGVGEGGVDGLFAGRGFDEVGAGHHADGGGSGDIGVGAEFAGGEDRFDVGFAAGFAELFHLLVEGFPIAAEDVGSGDDDVDFFGSVGYRGFDFFELEGLGVEASGESGGDGGDGNVGAFEILDGFGDVAVVDADGSDVDGVETEGLEGLGIEGVFGLGAESADVAGGVVSGEGCEVDALEGADEPGGLVGFFDRAAGGKVRGAAVDGRPVDGQAVHPVQVQGLTGVAGFVGGDEFFRGLGGGGVGAQGLREYIRGLELRLNLLLRVNPSGVQ